MNKLYLGAYWGDRTEALDSCAARLQIFIASLADCSVTLGVWLPRGEGLIGHLDHLSPREDFCSLLEAGKVRKDFGGEVVSQLGYSAGLWNGKSTDTEMASLSVACGLSAGNPHLSNAVSVHFPTGIHYEDVAADFGAVFDAAVEQWEPDWAWVGTDELRNMQGNRKPLFGVLSFVRHGILTLDVALVAELGVTVDRIGSGLRLSVQPDALPDIAHQLADKAFRG